MSNHLDIARASLLAPAGLDENHLDTILSELMSYQVDSADLYFQQSHVESWFLEEGIVKSGNFDIEQGVGVRAVSGEKSGFAYADEIMLPALQDATQVAGAIASRGQTHRVKAWHSPKVTELYPAVNPLQLMEDAAKIDLLKAADAAARAADPRVSQVMVSLAAAHDVVMVADSDGTLAGDVRPMVRMNVSVIVESNGRTEQGSSGGGGRRSYQWLQENNCPEKYAKEAVRQALVQLDAVAAPAGNMTVVLGSGWPGVLLHEAIGHGLEGDFNRKGTSAFSGRVGDRVASSLCTIVDDGTLADRRGSLNIDDEGVPSQCTTLIEDGVLKGYMQDKMNARLMGQQSTANGRRESFAYLPMPRMTNTYMLPGESEPQEIIESVENGLYAVNFGGGQVDITSGKFVFSASEAYLIENGKMTTPVKGATLVGDGPDVLTRVSMVGNDLALDEGVGVCGKAGQSVPVGVGQPTLRVDGLTVGGTQQ